MVCNGERAGHGAGTDGVVHLVVVRVLDLRAGLDAGTVVEIIPLVWISRLPKAPAAVEGVIDVRGRIVPVIDLRARFGRPPMPPRLSDHLVVVDVAGRELALHVDRAVDLVSVPAGDIDAGALPELDYAAGVARLPDDLLVIHDLAAFLSYEEGLELDAALAGAGVTTRGTS